MKVVLVNAVNFLGGESMGEIRVRRFLRNLHRVGWRPIIISNDKPAVWTENADNYEVVRIRGFEPAQWYRRLRRRDASASRRKAPARDLASLDTRFTTWIKRWFMIPDPVTFLSRPALRAARNVLASRSVDLVFASLAPRTDLRVAARVASEFGLPCVGEFRDLWTGNFYDNLAAPTRFHAWIHERMESATLHRCAHVACVSPGLKRYLETRYPDLAQRFSVNWGFFDPEEYPPRSARGREAPLRICYAGKFYFHRQPGVFLEGLSRFVRAENIGPDRLRFIWLGEIIGVAGLKEAVAAMGLEPYIEYYGQVPHARALEALVNSDVALIVQAARDSIHIPGKIYEALGARTPILYVSPKFEGTDLVERAGGGLCVPHDPGAIADALSVFYRFYSENASWPFNEAEVEQFSLNTFLRRMVDLFEETMWKHKASSCPSNSL